MGIELKGISKSWHQQQILHKVSFKCDAGETLVLLGPSGAGKSSLLRLMNLLDTPDEGELLIAGERFAFPEAAQQSDYTKRTQLLRGKVGMVFQQYHLWPHLTVEQNLLEAPLKVLGMNRSEAVDKASYLSLVEQGSQQKVDEAKAMAAAEQLLKKGLSFSLDNLSLSVNKAPLQAKGGVDLAANDKLQVNNLPMLISQLKGQLNLQAGKELVAMIPNGQQMVGSMVNAGFIKQEADGKLSVEFKLADGKTTANGQPLPLL